MSQRTLERSSRTLAAAPGAAHPARDQKSRTGGALLIDVLFGCEEGKTRPLKLFRGLGRP